MATKGDIFHNGFPFIMAPYSRRGEHISGRDRYRREQLEIMVTEKVGHKRNFTDFIINCSNVDVVCSMWGNTSQKEELGCSKAYSLCNLESRNISLPLFVGLIFFIL